jgi:tetratricopeptide (TPR) repeat protein
LEAQGVARPSTNLAAVDTTGGGMIDIAVSLVDPRDPVIQQPPGDLLVYLCQGGQYTLVYQHKSGEMQGAAQFHEALDLNADGAAELVIGYPTCGAHTCFETLEILAWNGETFENRLSGDSSDLPYPEVAVSDTDGDGRYDLAVTASGFGSVGAGPQRSLTRLWVYSPASLMWELAGDFPGTAQYRVHVVHDADAYARLGEYERALRFYQQVIDDPTLQEWDTHSYEDLVAYARFKIVLVSLIIGQQKLAEAHYQELVGQFPPDSPQYVFVELSVLFRDGFLAGNAPAGCREVRTYITQYPERVLSFFDYGYGNPAYTAEDICPW